MKRYICLIISVILSSVSLVGCKAIMRTSKSTPSNLGTPGPKPGNGDKINPITFEFQNEMPYVTTPYEREEAEDLNGDGTKEDIKLNVTPEKDGYLSQVVLKINNSEFQYSGENVCEGLQIIDIDEADKLKELAIFQEGPSADPLYRIFQYDGDKINDIGRIESYIVKLDGKGRVYRDFDVLDFLWPKVYIGYLNLEENKLIYKTYSTKTIINREFQVTRLPSIDDSPWIVYKNPSAGYEDSNRIDEIKLKDNIKILDLADSGTRLVALKIKTPKENSGWLVHMFGGD